MVGFLVGIGTTMGSSSHRFVGTLSEGPEHGMGFIWWFILSVSHKNRLLVGVMVGGFCMGSASCTLGNYYYWVGLCISIISLVYMSSPVVVGQFCSLLSYCLGHFVTVAYLLMVLVYLFFISYLPLLYTLRICLNFWKRTYFMAPRTWRSCSYLLAF
jgi:hypothetical protein